MKHVIKIALVLALIMVLSVNTFAAVVKPSIGKYLYNDSNGVLTLGTFDTKSMTETQKDFLREFFNHTKGTNHRMVTWMSASPGDLICFYIMTTASSSTLATSSGKLQFPSGVSGVRSMCFRYDTTKSLFSMTDFGTSTRIFDCIMFSDIQFTSSLGDPFYQDITKPVAFVDNDGLINGGGDDSSSDVSSGGVSDPATPSAPPAVDFPDIPQVTNEYVPYDTSVWNQFLAWVKSAIGNATNIGFIIFGFIMSILIVIAIVKKFTKAN